MLPMVPKVRVGEVLRGTRNLRHWLRVASILHNLELIHRTTGFQDFGKHTKNKLYTPRKEDDFIVAANTPFHFAVWSGRENIVLVFMNSQGKYADFHADYMNPTIFPTWFVRTGKYHLDLPSWPHYACYVWGMFHMGGMYLPKSPLLFSHKPHVIPFNMHKDCNSLEYREFALKSAKQAISCGILKGDTRKTLFVSKYSPHHQGFGPQRQQIGSMEMNIRDYLNVARRALNPRGKPAADLEKKSLEFLLKYKENEANPLANFLTHSH